MRVFTATILMCLSFLVFGQKGALVNNEDVRIAYVVKNDLIVFVIESLQDNSDEMAVIEEEYVKKHNDHMVLYGADSRDNALIEIDLNQNGQFDVTDIGYCYGSQSIFFPHYLPVEKGIKNRVFTPPYSRSKNNTKKFVSRAKAKGKFGSLKTSAHYGNHPIWYFIVPLSDILHENKTIKARFYVYKMNLNHRLNGRWKDEHHEYFIYPPQPLEYNDQKGNRFETLTIDLSEYDFPSLIKKKEAAKQADQEKTVIWRQAIQTKWDQAPTISEWEGVYLNGSGKHLLLKSFNFDSYYAYGGESDRTHSDAIYAGRKNAKPFLKNDIQLNEDVPFISIEEFKGFVLQDLHSMADKVELFRLEKRQAYPKVETKYMGYISGSSKFADYKFDDEPKQIEEFYTFQNPVPVRRQTTPTGAVNYVHQEDLKLGYYAIKADSKAWVFKIE